MGDVALLPRGALVAADRDAKLAAEARREVQNAIGSDDAGAGRMLLVAAVGPRRVGRLHGGEALAAVDRAVAVDAARDRVLTVRAEVDDVRVARRLGRALRCRAFEHLVRP